jgi:tyrosine-protein kinase Etk/Wzc
MAIAKKESSVIDVGDLKALWRIISRNWFFVPILLAVSYVSFVFYSYRLETVHSVRTLILLKSIDEYTPQSVLTDNGLGYSSNGIYRSYVDNSNEIRIIQSYDLIERAIKKMKLDVSYFIEGRVRVSEVYVGTPYRISVLNINPAYYEQDFKLRILSPEKYEISYQKGDHQITKAGFFDKEIVEPQFRLMINKVGEINNVTIKTLGTINYLFKIHSLSALVYRFKSSITIENPDYTNILQVTASDGITERAKEFLDTLASVYIDNTLEQYLELNSNTQDYINKELVQVQGILNGIQDTLQIYKKDKGILDVNRETSDYFEKLSDYDRQKTGWVLRMQAMDALEDYIIQNKDPQFLPPAIYLSRDDEFLQKNAMDLYTMQTGRNTLLVTSTENNLALKVLDDKIDRFKKDLLVYISNSRIAAKSRISDVEQQIALYTNNIKGMPEKVRGLIDIQREEKVNENLYTFLLQKQASTFIARASIVPQAKIIEKARDTGMVHPDKKKIMLGFLGAGLALALLIIVIRVMFYQRVESIDELKTKTDLPVLGEILFNSKMKELTIPVESDPRSPITESFRTIRTNLQYMAPDTTSKICVVTSNSPGEGKTFCSINLSAILSKAGKKVLLLELDLHKPRVQKGLGMSSEIGISTILISKNGIPECVLKTEIENLDVILSGPIPPNASELVLSDNLEKIFEYGRAHYDYVIVDTPPVGLISDALVMMRKADASLFVLNTKFAFKDAISSAHELVQLNNLKNFGFILNGVKRKRSKYYYNKYAYGYGYGYGRGYGAGGYGGYGGYGSYGGYRGYGDKS